MSDDTKKSHKLISGNKSFAAALQRELGDEPVPTKQGKLGLILAIAKTDEGRGYLLNHQNEKVRQLMEARIAVRSWPLHIKRIERLERMARAADGKLPVALKYAGAHTGRWSGSEKVNLQNLGARTHLLVSRVRSLIEAPKGYTLAILDFSQIEARGLVWIAEQNDMVRDYAEGRQVYCEFASEFIGHRIRKPKKTDSEIVAKWYGEYRQMGKIGILGCGYGMGWKKLIDYAKNTFKVDITPKVAKEIIRLYRRRNPMVVLFWEKVERAFRLATQTGQSYELSYGLRFLRDGDTTIIQLPSSRRLYYTKAQIGGTTRRPYLWMPEPKAPQKVIYMWGGYLTENIVQAMSRDILAEAVLEIEKQLGLRVALIVHDDLSSIVPEDKAELLKTKIEDIARVTPTWAPGLPIDIEGKISRRYIKI